MSSDNSYKGPFWCDDDKDEDEDDVDVDEEASSINSDEDDDTREFMEFIEEPMDIESQISSPPPSLTTQFPCQASLAPLSFNFGSWNTWFACPPIWIVVLVVEEETRRRWRS